MKDEMLENELRDRFWADRPDLERKELARLGHYPANGSQNTLSADTRIAFTDFVETLVRSGEISEAFAASVTL